MGPRPQRFRGTTLVDWMRAADTGFRFLSVATKDRSAILQVGRSKGPVFWYPGGRFITSSYYADALPAWLTAGTRATGPERLAGTRWTPLLPDTAYAEPDAQPV